MARLPFAPRLNKPLLVGGEVLAFKGYDLAWIIHGASLRVLKEVSLLVMVELLHRLATPGRLIHVRFSRILADARCRGGL